MVEARRRLPRLPREVETFLGGYAEWSTDRLSADRARELLDRYERWTNLEKARDIVDEIGELKAVQSHLKAAFKNDELDGGWKAALTHPLFVDATVRIDELEQQLKELI